MRPIKALLALGFAAVVAITLPNAADARRMGGGGAHFHGGGGHFHGGGRPGWHGGGTQWHGGARDGRAAAATTVAADTTAGAMDGEPPVLRPAQRQPTGHRAIAPRTSGMATATFRRPSTSANSAKNVCYFSE